MPHITTDRIKEIRETIKHEFPSKKGWKFSITRRHYSTVCVKVLAAPVRMTENEARRESVNQFYISEHYKDKPDVKEALLKLYGIINEGNRTVSEDGDYGSIPAFYVDLGIGDYEKPFQYVGA